MGPRINVLKEKMETQSQLQNEIVVLGEKADRLENISVANELLITGIPSMQNENLLNVFNNICSIIEVPIPNVRTNFRVKNNKNKNINPVD